MDEAKHHLAIFKRSRLWCSHNRYYPYVQTKQIRGVDSGRPAEQLPLLGQHASFEEAATQLVEQCVEPAGFTVERLARVPYLCLGDELGSSMYELDDCVLVCRRTEDGPSRRWISQAHAVGECEHDHAARQAHPSTHTTHTKTQAFPTL
jgi:hypothetical protein